MRFGQVDAGEPVPMDMTPMIDVVFQLILFFMLITDLSQRELEDLELPRARSAVEDRPDPSVARPIVNVLQDGRILVAHDVKYDPATDGDDLGRLAAGLADLARRMPKTYDAAAGAELPDDPLLIRADRNAEFGTIQRVVELCGKQGIRIWKIELATARGKAKE